jgi:hypothetical protein
MKYINMRKKIYSCENIQMKMPKNLILPLLVRQPFFEVVPSGTTQGWVCLTNV